MYALALLTTGCAQYYYYTRTPNADGAAHEAVASWSVTKRALWFDESSETVRVTLQCGKTVAFQQRLGGVFMLYDPSAWLEPKLVAGKPYCGRLPGITKLEQLAVGQQLSVEVWCTHVDDDEGFGVAAPMLPTGAHRLGLIQRTDRPPEMPACRDPRAAPASQP